VKSIPFSGRLSQLHTDLRNWEGKIEPFREVNVDGDDVFGQKGEVKKKGPGW
jgi:hypothetical protein